MKIFKLVALRVLFYLHRQTKKNKNFTKNEDLAKKMVKRISAKKGRREENVK